MLQYLKNLSIYFFNGEMYKPTSLGKYCKIPVTNKLSVTILN